MESKRVLRGEMKKYRAAEKSEFGRRAWRESILGDWLMTAPFLTPSTIHQGTEISTMGSAQGSLESSAGTK